MNDDSRMLLYLSILTLVFSCVVFGYSLVFFGLGPQFDHMRGSSIMPAMIIVAGIIFAAVNAIATNVISDQVGKKLETFLPVIRYGIPVTVFLVTLVLSIFIAFLSA